MVCEEDVVYEFAKPKGEVITGELASLGLQNNFNVLIKIKYI